MRNARIILETATEIIKSPRKNKDDVSAIYHRLVENFEWSNTSGESDDEDDGPGFRRSDRSNKSKNRESNNPKQWKIDCKHLLDEMVANPLSEPFREAVCEIEYPDYHRCINTPMDLSLVRESLNCGDYQSPVDFQKEVALIFKNSKSYNTNPKSKVLAMTHKLESWFDERMSQLLHDWRRSVRKMTQGRSSRNEKRKVKGKGKGTGKGQSNKINKTRKRSHDDDDETESESNDESESEFSEEEKKPPTRANSRLPSPSARGVKSEDPVFDPNNPQPCSSKSILRSAGIKNEAENLTDQVILSCQSI